MINPFAGFRDALGKKRFTTGTLPITGTKSTYDNPGIQSFEPNEQDEQDPEAGYYKELEAARMGGRGPALAAYQKGLTEQPTWEQNKPSWKRRLAGALISSATALGGDTATAVGLGRSVVRAPYDTARMEYENRMKGLGASAKLEQDEVEAKTNSIKAAHDYSIKFREQRQKEKDAEETAAWHGRTATTAEYNAMTARQRIAYERTHWNNQDALTGEGLDIRTSDVNSQIQDRNARQTLAREQMANALKIAQIQAGRKTPATPQAQQDAIDGALRELAADPFVSRFITKGDAPGTLNIGNDDGSDEYKNFKQKLIAGANRRLAGHPFAETGEDFQAVDPEVDIRGIGR